MNVIVEDPQSLSNESPSVRPGLGWVADRTQTTSTQKGMSPTSKDWLSFLFMTLGKAIPHNVFFFPPH